VPVDDVGLVPDFEVPGADLGGAIALDEMRDEGADEIAPHAVVARGIVDRAGHGGPGVMELVLGDSGDGRGQVLRHEAEFDKWTHACLLVGVEGAIGDGEVVNGLAAGADAEDVRGAPLQLRHAVAGGEQVMRADVDGGGAEVVQLAQQLLPAGHGGVIRLVEAEPVGDWLKGAGGAREIDLDVDWRG